MDRKLTWEDWRAYFGMIANLPALETLFDGWLRDVYVAGYSPHWAVKELRWILTFDLRRWLDDEAREH